VISTDVLNDGSLRDAPVRRVASLHILFYLFVLIISIMSYAFHVFVVIDL
jgi:hypothetical protein